MDRKQFNKTLGTHVSQLRKKKRISQSQLARLTDKDRQSIFKLENGEFSPTLFYLHQVAQALNVPLTSIVDFIE